MKPFDIAGAALAAQGPHEIHADIEFARDAGGMTYVRHQRAGYPFHLGRALRSPGDPAGMATLYLQSCSGGIFGGDDLRLRIDAGAGAAAHVTSGASTIVHSMERDPARQRMEIHAREDSFLEYLPDPAILFPCARLDSGMRMRVHPGSTVIVGDAMLLHDPTGGDGVFDWLRSETRIEDSSGKLLACDRFHIDGSQFVRGLAGIAGTSAAQGSLFVVTGLKQAGELVAVMRAAMTVPGIYAGAALLPNCSGAWARMLAVDADALKSAMFNAWAAARNLLTGCTPLQRRK
ncbi:MAG TPA: urease accessory protein UreD [Burkholderiales bacterium]|nr:urease accessory protein UreD [Burkholderiales bacterium]